MKILRPFLFLAAASLFAVSCEKKKALEPVVEMSTPAPTPEVITSDSVVSIPKVSEAALADGSWLRQAYRADVLVPLSPKSLGSAKLYLAWTEKGLLARVEAEDETPNEADSASFLWNADSVEIFAASAPGSEDFLQVIASPGRVEKFPDPRWFIIDRRAKKPEAAAPELQAEKTEAIYALDVLLPWTNFQKPPQERDVIALQVIVNDGLGKKRTSRIWYPVNGVQSDHSLMHAVRLAATASPPREAVATAGIAHKSDVDVEIYGVPALVGKPVVIKSSGVTLDGQVMKAVGDASRLTWTLPGSLARQKDAALQVMVDGVVLPAVKIPNLEKERRRWLNSLPLTAQPAVFDGDKFPEVEFLNKDLVHAAFGDYELTTRYFNAQGEEVSAPDEAGRYGVLVGIQAPEGLKETRRITLFKTPKPYQPSADICKVQLELPEAFGLPPALVKSQAGSIQEFVAGKLNNLAGSDGGWAVLLAGLNDLAHQPGLKGLDAGAIDREWWDGIDAKLGLARTYQYLEYAPEGYNDDPSKSWPLVLFLHGAGERGDDLRMITRAGLPAKLEAGMKLPAVVIAPQCPQDEWWSNGPLMKLIEEAQERYRIDPKRIYVTGLSMGGYGSWNLATRYPEKFAAVAPICGGINPEAASRLAKLPIWTFHGDKDNLVPIRLTQNIVDALKKQKAPVKFTVYPGVGHDSWTATYDNPELYTWMLQQKRP